MIKHYAFLALGAVAADTKWAALKLMFVILVMLVMLASSVNKEDH